MLCLSVEKPATDIKLVRQLNYGQGVCPRSALGHTPLSIIFIKPPYCQGRRVFFRKEREKIFLLLVAGQAWSLQGFSNLIPARRRRSRRAIKKRSITNMKSIKLSSETIRVLSEIIKAEERPFPGLPVYSLSEMIHSLAARHLEMITERKKWDSREMEVPWEV
jgi:hypothetical protein